MFFGAVGAFFAKAVAASGSVATAFRGVLVFGGDVVGAFCSVTGASRGCLAAAFVA